jgi:hypothetical protein
MNLNNTTPFVLFSQVGEVAPPARSLTLILKGTFKLGEDRVWRPAPKQQKAERDKPFMDDLGRSLAWPDDYVLWKPHVDLIVIGSFHQPGGEPAPEGRAKIKLGPIEKELIFRGPRVLTLADNGQWSISKAQPIVDLPLRWEYSFGGLSDPRNPMGLGIDALPGEDNPKRIPLPQIEYPDEGFRQLGDKPRPANFAPVPQRFAERLSKLGTRDQRWATFRAPLPPQDYDPSVNNAAPNDQQAKGYPRGNEAFTLINLHPRIANLTSQLPGLRVRAGILRKQPLGLMTEEVRMVLDTVVVLPEDDELVLLWRGVTPLQGQTAAEVLMAQVETESLDVERAPFEGLSQRLWDAYRKAVPEDKPKPPPDISGEMAEMRKTLAKVDLPPDLRTLVEKESNPQTIFDALEKYVNDTAAMLQKKYPPAV